MIKLRAKVKEPCYSFGSPLPSSHKCKPRNLELKQFLFLFTHHALHHTPRNPSKDVELHAAELLLHNSILLNEMSSLKKTKKQDSVALSLNQRLVIKLHSARSDSEEKKSRGARTKREKERVGVRR